MQQAAGARQLHAIPGMPRSFPKAAISIEQAIINCSPAEERHEHNGACYSLNPCGAGQTKDRACPLCKAAPMVRTEAPLPSDSFLRAARRQSDRFIVKQAQRSIFATKTG